MTLEEEVQKARLELLVLFDEEWAANFERLIREECAQIADDDLLAQPGVIAAEDHRWDGGHSAAAARRIAAKIRALSQEAKK